MSSLGPVHPFMVWNLYLAAIPAVLALVLFRSPRVTPVWGLGFVAWVLWVGVHVAYLVGFQNRVLVLTRWALAYFTRGRGARIVHR